MNKKFTTFETDDSISKYFKDVRKSQILTPERELILAKLIKKGDESAKEELINANLKFVVSIAKEYQNQGLPLCDLISEGNYGLIKAATRFDHKRGFRFISYAVWWIKQSIIQSLNDNARVVRLPVNVINKITKLNKEFSKFESDNEREPVYGDIINGDEVSSMIKFPKSTSLNQHINDDGDELIELIVTDDIMDDVETSIRIKNELIKTLNILDEREKQIIEAYFGLDTDVEAMTLEAIGEKYLLTKERIRQIKEKAIRKLRYNSKDLLILINE